MPNDFDSKRRDLTLKIYGTDDAGKPFFQLASAHGLTPKAAVLEGVAIRLKIGTIVGVQYDGRKARAQVVWVGEVNGSFRTKIEIRLLPADACPWESHLDPVSPKPEDSVRERRRHQRYKVRISLYLQEPNSKVKLQAQCSDISVSGCYVYTLLPLPIGTLLVAGIWIGMEQIELNCIVRTSDGNVGMGIEFMNLSDAQEQSMQTFLVHAVNDPSFQS